MIPAAEWRPLATRRGSLYDLTDDQFGAYLDGLRAWQRRMVRQFWTTVIALAAGHAIAMLAGALLPDGWSILGAALSIAITALMIAHICQALLFRSCLRAAERDHARRMEEDRQRRLDERRIKATNAIRGVIRAEDHHPANRKPH